MRKSLVMAQIRNVVSLVSPKIVRLVKIRQMILHKTFTFSKKRMKKHFGYFAAFACFSTLKSKYANKVA